MLEQINNEIVYLLCKGFPENPCRKIGVDRLCLPLGDNLKRKML
jgi:hypothetical protein